MSVGHVKNPKERNTMELDDLIEYLEDGNVVNGSFTIKSNDDSNLEVTVVVPNEDEDEDDLIFTQEIPSAMLKMAKMLGGF